jgi:Yip1 domain
MFLTTAPPPLYKRRIMSNLIDRAIRAAKLDATLYEEVEADTTAFGQAMTVIVLSSIAAGIGGAFHGGIGWIILGAIAALVGWYVWAYLAYLIGTKILPEPQTEADVGQLLRTTGFASSPGLLRVLGIIPGLMSIVFFIASIWMLVAMVVAVKQALDYRGTARAVGVCVIGWLVQMIVLLLVFYLMGAPSLGVQP